MQYLKISMLLLITTFCLSTVLRTDLLFAKTIESIDVGLLKKKISDSQSEVLIVDFWATFCAPCTKQAPIYSSIYKKYKSKGLSIIGISFDFDKNRAEEFINELGIEYPVYLGNEDVGFHYNIVSIPTTHIYDSNGNLVKSYVGLVGEDELTQVIEDLLSAKYSGENR